jgi:hypothetical protein
VEKSVAAGECARRKSSGEGTAADSNENGCKWLRPDRALLNLIQCTGSCDCSSKNEARREDPGNPRGLHFARVARRWIRIRFE